MKTIDATFVPLIKSSTIPELMAIRGRLRDQTSKLESERLNLRQSLARKAKNLRRLAHKRGYANGARQMQIQLISKYKEISAKSEEIYLRCQNEALDIIRTLCISVFGECPACCEDLLLCRIRQSMELLKKTSFCKIIIAKGSQTHLISSDFLNLQIEESAELTCGKAILETRAGRIEIDVIEDLEHAFLDLHDQMNKYSVTRQSLQNE